jgi:hypothetical protein
MRFLHCVRGVALAAAAGFCVIATPRAAQADYVYVYVDFAIEGAVTRVPVPTLVRGADRLLLRPARGAGSVYCEIEQSAALAGSRVDMTPEGIKNHLVSVLEGLVAGQSAAAAAARIGQRIQQVESESEALRKVRAALSPDGRAFFLVQGGPASLSGELDARTASPLRMGQEVTLTGSLGGAAATPCYTAAQVDQIVAQILVVMRAVQQQFAGGTTQQQGAGSGVKPGTSGLQR